MSIIDADGSTEFLPLEIIKPKPNHAAIARVAGDSDAAIIVSEHADDEFEAANEISIVTTVRNGIETVVNIMSRELSRTSAHLSGTQQIDSLVLDEQERHPASFYKALAIFIAALLTFGMAVLLNTVAATISGSGEIASLTGDPWRAMLFGTLPLIGMAVIHILHHFILWDSMKRLLLFTVIGITIACLIAWVFLFSFGFPLDGMAVPVSDNLFAASEESGKASHPLTWLIISQFLGEIAAGGVVGIALEHYLTMGKRKVVFKTATYEELSGFLDDLARKRVQGDHWIGLIEDYKRRFEASRRVYRRECLGILREIENQLVAQHAIARRDLIIAYSRFPFETE